MTVIVSAVDSYTYHYTNVIFTQTQVIPDRNTGHYTTEAIFFFILHVSRHGNVILISQ